MKLATFKNDGFQIINSFEMNKKHPDTFEIPPKSERENQKAGAIVKCIFEYSGTERITERMWIIITGKQGEYYTGTLDNDPVNDVLSCGEPVVFKADNIVNIYCP